MGQQLPAKPSEKHKNGIRILLKLSPSCGGDKPVREIAGSAKAFLGGIEQVYSEYLQARRQSIPASCLSSPWRRPRRSSPAPGQTKSTNYRPTFQINGWAKRPDDLVHTATRCRQHLQLQHQWQLACCTIDRRPDGSAAE